MVTIRTAGPDDRAAVLQLVLDAFAPNEGGGREEHDIVVRTWELDAAAPGLELVAVEGNDVVGHVLGAWGDLDGRAVVGIAPLAVTPARQGEGIGSSLMHELIATADAQGLPMVVLLGSVEYYSRFGFEPSGPLAITYPPVGAGNPHFQVRRLSADDGSYRGNYRYCWEFDA